MTSGSLARDSYDPGDVDPDIQMGIVLNLIALLVEEGAAISTGHVRTLATYFARLTDVPLVAANRQLAQMALLGFLSPLPASSGDIWELTDNDFAAVLRDEAAPRVAPVLGALRARAARIARTRTHQAAETVERSKAAGTMVALTDSARQVPTGDSDGS